MKTRTSKAFINTFWLAVKEIIAFACNFILPPLILSRYGSNYNGIAASITQFLNAISLLRLGLAGATRSSLYKTLSNNNEDGTNTIINASQNYLNKTGIFVGIYILFLCVFFPLFYKETIDIFDCIILVLALGAATFSQYIFGLTYCTLLESDQKSFIVSISEAIVNCGSTIFACFLILGGTSFPIVKLISSLIWITFPLFIYFFSKKKYKLKRDFRVPSRTLKTKKDAMAHSVANIIHENVDVVSLTVACPPSIVSVFSIYKLVTNGIKQVLSVLIGSFEAPFGEMIAKKENENIVKNLDFFEFIVQFFISVVFSITLVLLIPFINLYTLGIDDVVYAIPLYAFLVVVCETIYCFKIPYQTLIQASGHYKETKVGAIVEAIINLVITVCLVWKLGLIGAVIGTICANSFKCIFYSFYIQNKLVSRSKGTILKKATILLITFITCYCFSMRINAVIGQYDWLHWALSGVIDTIVSVFVYIIISHLFFKSSLNRLKDIFKTTLRRKHAKKNN